MAPALGGPYLICRGACVIPYKSILCRWVHICAHRSSMNTIALPVSIVLCSKLTVLEAKFYLPHHLLNIIRPVRGEAAEIASCESLGSKPLRPFFSTRTGPVERHLEPIAPLETTKHHINYASHLLKLILLKWKLSVTHIHSDVSLLLSLEIILALFFQLFSQPRRPFSDPDKMSLVGALFMTCIIENKFDLLSISILSIALITDIEGLN